MKFDLITDNGTLWAVRYEDSLDNVLDTILDQWNDVDSFNDYLRELS